MEEGFAIAGTWMNWVRKEGFLDGALWRDDKLVTFFDVITPAHIPGVRCRACGVVVLDTSRLH